MPVTSGQYSSVETQIYKYVTETLGYNTAVACGILANIQRESGFNHEAKGDNGKAYGLCQWNSRREELFSHAKTRTPSVQQQLSFMLYELNNKEIATKRLLKDKPNTGAGAYEAAEVFCEKYERPANVEKEKRERGVLARDTYYKFYAGSGGSNSRNIGIEIVKKAREQLEKPYKQGGSGPNSFDMPGLIYYCYKEAGVEIPKLSTPYEYYNKYLATAKKIYNHQDIAAGDILIYDDDNNENNGFESISLATGEGSRFIFLSRRTPILGETKSIGNPACIFRILSDSDTSSYYDMNNTEDSPNPGVESGGGPAVDYISLTASDPNTLVIAQNLSDVKKEGYDFGYLIDITNGGYFKFYIPEFSETAGAKWSPIELRGRSVEVLAYDSTSSRKINISLELYAGVGVYKATSGESGEDTISRMHRDANFVKSLEYPDYTNIITRPPATVHLILGAAVNIVGVVSDVSVEHMKPLDSMNRAMYIKMSFTVTQTAVNPPDYTDIRKGQYHIINTGDVETWSTSSGD